MRKTPKSPGEKIVKDIKRATRKHYSSEEKIRIVLDGLRGEDSIAELCRREGIAQGIYYKWSEALIVKKLHEQELRLQQENAQRNDLEHKRKSLIESERISMDLHDGVMGSLQLIRVLAESATNKKMQAIYSASSDALNEIRLILEFRNTEVKSLNFFVNTVRNKFIVPLIDIETPITVTTNIDSFNAEIDAFLSPDVGMLKVVQEAINNAVHRAKCECLDIKFNIIEGHILEVTIENTGGRTLDMSKIEKTPGFGLKNMKRRILDSNGEFSIVSIDGGARLRFTCPLSPVQV